MSDILNRNVCTACGSPRRQRLLYDIDTFLPYCDNPYICGEKHPNTPKNMFDRGMTEVRLVPFEEAKNFYNQHLEAKFTDSDMLKNIKRLTDKPIPVRVIRTDLAQFLGKLHTELNSPSMSETIRYCIEFTMNRYNKRQEPIERARSVERELATPEAPTKQQPSESDVITF